MACLWWHSWESQGLLLAGLFEACIVQGPTVVPGASGHLPAWESPFLHNTGGPGSRITAKLQTQI